MLLLKLVDFYIENKNQIRLNFSDGTSRIVSVDKLHHHLESDDLHRVREAVKLKSAYFKKFPHWLKVWVVVAVTSLFLFSTSSHAAWRFIPWRPTELAEVLMSQQSPKTEAQLSSPYVSGSHSPTKAVDRPVGINSWPTKNLSKTLKHPEDKPKSHSKSHATNEMRGNDYDKLNSPV